MAPSDDVPEAANTSLPLADADLYRTLIERIPVTLYVDIVTPDGSKDDQPLFISPHVETLLGWTPEEWVADPSLWNANLHPDDRERIAELAFGSEEAFTDEYRIYRKDGRMIWVREIASILDTGDATQTLWHGVIFDITQSKEAEAQLVEAREQFHSLVENIPAVVYLDPVDEDLNTIYVSPKIEELLGVTPEEWIQNPSIWREMLHPEDADKTWETYEQYRDSGEPLESEYRMFHRDGRIVWIQEQAEILNDQDGNPYLIQGFMHDITGRKHAEEQREFQARLLESISDAVIAYDTEIVVTSWNRAAQVLYGWGAEDMLGKPLPEALRYDPSELTTIWDAFVEAMEGWRGRTIHRDKDGYEIQIETMGLPLVDASGNVRGYVMVNREVAES